MLQNQCASSAISMGFNNNALLRLSIRTGIGYGILPHQHCVRYTYCTNTVAAVYYRLHRTSTSLISAPPHWLPRWAFSPPPPPAAMLMAKRTERFGGSSSSLVMQGGRPGVPRIVDGRWSKR